MIKLNDNLFSRKEGIMKVLGVSGSPRKDGNTERAIKTAFKVFEQEGMETEFLSLAEKPVQPCTACGSCTKTKECVLDDPNFDMAVEQFRQADGILVGSPVYFGSATPQVMALLDRVGYISRRNGNFLRRKVGAAVSVARRAGKNFTFAQLNYFFLIGEMIVPGSTYWNVAIGREAGEVEQDEEGMKTLENLAMNMSWLMKKLAD
jgi:multimeric flavodoxin WrbA